jgi:hypothetical protein
VDSMGMHILACTTTHGPLRTRARTDLPLLVCLLLLLSQLEHLWLHRKSSGGAGQLRSASRTVRCACTQDRGASGATPMHVAGEQFLNSETPHTHTCSSPRCLAPASHLGWWAVATSGVLLAVTAEVCPWGCRTQHRPSTALQQHQAPTLTHEHALQESLVGTTRPPAGEEERQQSEQQQQVRGGVADMSMPRSHAGATTLVSAAWHSE